MTHGVAQVSLPQIVCQQFIFARRAGFVVGQFESQLRGWKGLGNVFRCADAECDRGSSLKLMRLLWRGSIDVHCQRRFWHKWLSDPTFWRREWERVDSEKSTESCGHSFLLCIAAYRRWVVLCWRCIKDPLACWVSRTMSTKHRSLKHNLGWCSTKPGHCIAPFLPVRNLGSSGGHDGDKKHSRRFKTTSVD